MSSPPELQTIFKGDTSGLKRVIPIAERMTPKFYQSEQAAIFRNAWLMIGSSTELKEKGSYFVSEVPALNASLLVVRGSDDKIRVFHNVCRHRGDRVVHSGQGCRRTFTCGFHGWTYANTGKLLAVTDESQFCGLDKEATGLLEVNSEVWETMIFVNFAQQPKETLKEWLGDMYEQYHGFADNRELIAHHRVVIKTNWNLAHTAFCEGYHNLYIHKNTVPDYQGGNGNPNRHRAFIEVGRHFGRYSAHRNPNHRPTPAQKAVSEHSRPMFPAFPPVDPNSLPPGVNPSRFDEWAFDIVPIFPNFVFNPQANTHGFLWFWPIDHETTDIRVMTFAFKSDKPSDRIAQAHAMVRGREVLREDLATLESNFLGVSSGALPHIILSEQEMLIQNHYRAADEMLRDC